MYSQFLKVYLCLVRQPDECPYAVTIDRQIYCCHPQAERIAHGTLENETRLPPDTAI